MFVHPHSLAYLIAFALREVEAVLDARHAAGDELFHGGADHVRERKDAQHEEVHREQQVDVVLAEYLKWTFKFLLLVRKKIKRLKVIN